MADPSHVEEQGQVGQTRVRLTYLSLLPGISKRESPIGAGAVEERLRTWDVLTFSWPELVSFADGLHQTIWCYLGAVGADRYEPILAIDCFDTTSWDLVAPDGHPEGTNALSRVTRLWPTAD